uniref:Uncharacterized protein n=1 Tax=Oryza glumipatula TaxID=40148 RepID=A0A0D9YPB0_9ORYZ
MDCLISFIFHLQYTFCICLDCLGLILVRIELINHQSLPSRHRDMDNIVRLKNLKSIGDLVASAFTDGLCG